MIEMQAVELPDDAAFEAYLTVWRRELDANWDGGYAQIPALVRNDATLSAKAKLVYEQLLSFMWFKTDRCWPSQATLAEGTGYSRRTVIRALKELYERGYIECVRRGLGQTNYYFVNPLSFIRSFRPVAGPRTTVRMPHDTRMPLTDPAFLCGIADAIKRPVEPYVPEVTTCHTGSDTMAQPEVTDCHTNYMKTKLIQINKDRESDSSGAAATSEKEEFVAPSAIGNELSPLESNTLPSRRNSKPSSASLETGGAERAKEVKTPTTSEKVAKWQGIALAQGVSLVQLDALESYIKQCPRPDHIPMLVEECIDQVSRSFNNVQYLTSNRTQAAKLWQYARLKGMDHETVQDLFREWVRVAAKVPPFVNNKIAWFFRALHLEVLKALLPYELITPVTEEQPTTSQTDETPSQEQEEQREGEQETQDAESINQEQDALLAPTSDEQECQEQHPAPEPEYLLTEDPDAGWPTWASAAHWADRLRECVGFDRYGVDVLPTRFGRFGFYLYEQSHPERVWQYVLTSVVIARLEEEKKQRLHSKPRT